MIADAQVRGDDRRRLMEHAFDPNAWESTLQTSMEK
jgi:hypothetical protein